MVDIRHTSDAVALADQRVRAGLWRSCAGSAFIWCPHLGESGIKRTVLYISRRIQVNTRFMVAEWSRFAESIPRGESVINYLSNHFRIKTPSPIVSRDLYQFGLPGRYSTASLKFVWRWTNFDLGKKRNRNWFFVMITDFYLFIYLLFFDTTKEFCPLVRLGSKSRRINKELYPIYCG